MSEIKCNPGIHSILNVPEDQDTLAVHTLKAGHPAVYVRDEDTNIIRTEFPDGAIIDLDCTTDKATLIWHDGQTEVFASKDALYERYPKIAFMKERPVDRTTNPAHAHRSAECKNFP